ncbi:MAG: hypothetical protein EXS63_00665 [Candidatus Omnitrophica bacterium]|nr:hypothetical protein [Candidatus Omnitrophota bacterium]
MNHSEPSKPGLRAKTVKSLGAVAGVQLFKKGLSFVVSVLLYRFLSSKDFGLFALCESYLMFAMIFSDMGIEDAVIQTQADEPGKVIQTGFVMRIFFTFFAFLVLFLGAEYLALLVKTPKLAFPLRVVSLTVLTNLIAFKTEMSFKKGLRFEKFIHSETLAQIASSGIAFVLAWRGYGYWSLVISTIASQFFRVIFLNLQKPEKLSLEWDWLLAKKIWDKSKYGLLITLLYFALSRLVQFFVADRFGLSRVGYFYLAFNWSNFFVTYAVQFAGRVVFPAVSKIESDRSRVAKAYTEYLHRVALLAVPFSMYLVVLAPQLIPVILGPKWQPAVSLCQMLCLHGLIRALAAPSQTVLYGLGKFRKSFAFLLIELFVFLGLIYFLKSLGVTGFIVALIVSKAVGWVIPTWLVEKELSQYPVNSLKIILPYLGAGFFLMLGMVLLGNLLEAFRCPNMLYLFIQIPCGGMIYLTGYYIFHGINLSNLTSLKIDLKTLIQNFLKSAVSSKSSAPAG